MRKISSVKAHSTLSLLFSVIVIGCLFFKGVSPASGQTIVDEWSTVQAPKPPELKAVTLEPTGTALLVLDFVKQTCNAERRPRCLTSIPHVQALLKLARSKGISVVHSITTAATPGDILNDVAPLEGEPLVKSSADKFFKTDLEKILNDKGIKTVVVVGTAAHGAVLYTASQAAYREFCRTIQKFPAGDRAVHIFLEQANQLRIEVARFLSLHAVASFGVIISRGTELRRHSSILKQSSRQNEYPSEIELVLCSKNVSGRQVQIFEDLIDAPEAHASSHNRKVV